MSLSNQRNRYKPTFTKKLPYTNLQIPKPVRSPSRDIFKSHIEGHFILKIIVLHFLPKSHQAKSKKPYTTLQINKPARSLSRDISTSRVEGSGVQKSKKYRTQNKVLQLPTYCLGVLILKRIKGFKLDGSIFVGGVGTRIRFEFG